jgi:hypothetical protein
MMYVDRGFAGLDYLGPSELYPWMRRVTRLTATMILHWDSALLRNISAST